MAFFAGVRDASEIPRIDFFRERTVVIRFFPDTLFCSSVSVRFFIHRTANVTKLFFSPTTPISQ
jgi:hypothetical protein